MASGPPDWLSADATAVWTDLAAQGLTAGADRDALVVYCCAVADYAQAQRVLDRAGPLVQDAKGSVKRNPMTMVKAANAAVIRQLARELGLTSRAEPDEAARRSWRNSAAAEKTITALRSGGRIADVDAAAVALARHLAEALDRVDSARWPAQVASLARVQLMTLRTLRGLDDEPGGEFSIDEILGALSAPMGDSEEPGAS
jgi:P27 family predicted phage terminase small subunit